MDKKKLNETFALAFQNHQKNNFKVAENLYKKILKISPNHFESIFLLGGLSTQTKNFDLAKKLTQKAIQIKPDHANAHYNLGIVFYKLGEFQKAKNCYEKAVQIKSNHIDAHCGVGKCLEKTLNLDSNHRKTCESYGIILFKLNQHSKALTYLRKGSGFIRFTEKNLKII